MVNDSILLLKLLIERMLVQDETITGAYSDVQNIDD